LVDGLAELAGRAGGQGFGVFVLVAALDRVVRHGRDGRPAAGARSRLLGGALEGLASVTAAGVRAVAGEFAVADIEDQQQLNEGLRARPLGDVAD